MNNKKHLITFFCNDGHVPIDDIVYSCDSKIIFHDDDGYIVKKTVTDGHNISIFINYTTINGTHDFKSGVLFFDNSEHIIQKYSTHLSKQIGSVVYNKIGICYLGINIFNIKSNGL